MKRIIYGIALMLSSVALVSCEDEVSNISRITYYPTFEYSGEETYFLHVNDPFTEPGVIATEQGEEIDVKVDVAGRYKGTSGSTVNTTSADEYTITYSAVNKDGYSGSVSRSVFVSNTGNFTDNIEGIYSSTVVRNGTASAQYRNMKYVMVYKVGDNQYEISDGIGGYYVYGRGYADVYFARGMVVTANDYATNDWTLAGDVGVGAFGGVLKMTEFSINPANKTIHFVTDWSSGYKFDVTLTQIQF